MERTGCIADKNDKAKWDTPVGVISVTGQKFMNWTKRAGGGGAIDLAMHLQRCNFKNAVFWWFANNFPDYAIHTSQGSTSISNQVISLPRGDDSKLPQIRNYRRDDRCIPANLIDFLIRSGTLNADNRANAVFLLLGKEKRAVGAELGERIICSGMVWPLAQEKIWDVSTLKAAKPRKRCYVNLLFMPFPILPFIPIAWLYEHQVQIRTLHGCHSSLKKALTHRRLHPQPKF